MSTQALSTPVAGWIGYLTIDSASGVVGAGSGLRFTSENLDIPLGLQVMPGTHTGNRVDSILTYKIKRPAGSITFPLTVDHTVAIGSSEIGTAGLGNPAAYILNQAILPQTVSSDGTRTVAQFSEVPYLGNVTVLRGDIRKFVEDAWVNSLEMSASADSEVTCTINIKGLGGSVSSEDTGDTQQFTSAARAIHFNELTWPTADVLGLHYFGGSTGDYSVGGDAEATPIKPKSFTLSINNNIADDDSSNPSDPQKLNGFVLGSLSISCSITLNGAFGSNLDASGTSPTVVTAFSIGGLYTIVGGIWTARIFGTPDANGIATTELTLTGFKASDTCIEPGVWISGT